MKLSHFYSHYVGTNVIVTYGVGNVLKYKTGIMEQCQDLRFVWIGSLKIQVTEIVRVDLVSEED